MQLTESQVSASKLAEIFNQAFIDTKNLTNKDFIVDGDTINTKIIVDDERKRINYLFIMPIESKHSSNLHEKINTMNSDMLMVRFSTFKTDDGSNVLVADHSICYEKGLLAYHLISVKKRFENVVVDAVREYILD